MLPRRLSALILGLGIILQLGWLALRGISSRELQYAEAGRRTQAVLLSAMTPLDIRMYSSATIEATGALAPFGRKQPARGDAGS